MVYFYAPGDYVINVFAAEADCAAFSYGGLYSYISSKAFRLVGGQYRLEVTPPASLEIAPSTYAAEGCKIPTSVKTTPAFSVKCIDTTTQLPVAGLLL